MSKKCQICGKKSTMVQKRKLLRGNYNPTIKKRKYPNLQWLTIDSKPRIKACAKCIKARAKS